MIQRYRICSDDIFTGAIRLPVPETEEDPSQ